MGNPGSGKSALLPIAAAHLAVGDAAGVQIVGDDLREYSPEFRRLLCDSGLTAAVATDRDSGRWVEMALDYAREHRYSP